MYFIPKEQVGSGGRYNGTLITPSYLANLLIDICHCFFTLHKVSWAKCYIVLRTKEKKQEKTTVSLLCKPKSSCSNYRDQGTTER